MDTKGRLMGTHLFTERVVSSRFQCSARTSISGKHELRVAEGALVVAVMRGDIATWGRLRKPLASGPQPPLLLAPRSKAPRDTLSA